MKLCILGGFWFSLFACIALALFCGFVFYASIGFPTYCASNDFNYSNVSDCLVNRNISFWYKYDILVKSFLVITPLFLAVVASSVIYFRKLYSTAEQCLCNRRSMLVVLDRNNITLNELNSNADLGSDDVWEYRETVRNETDVLDRTIREEKEVGSTSDIDKMQDKSSASNNEKVELRSSKVKVVKKSTSNQKKTVKKAKPKT